VCAKCKAPRIRATLPLHDQIEFGAGKYAREFARAPPRRIRDVAARVCGLRVAPTPTPPRRARVDVDGARDPSTRARRYRARASRRARVARRRTARDRSRARDASVGAFEARRRARRVSRP